jgi:small-conductance mechanosensitive channel
MTNQPQIITDALDQMLGSFLKSLPNILAALAILILSIYLARVLQRLVRQGLVKRSAGIQHVELVPQMAYWSLILLGSFAALQQVGINLTAFLAGLGIAGIALGFALQDVSKNFIAGVLMLVQQPFGTGDVIEVSGYTGTVLTIDLRATHLHTLDGLLVLIPNGDVYINPITNFSKVKHRRVEIITNVAADSVSERVRAMVMDAVRTVPGLSEGYSIDIFTQNIGAAGAELVVYYWIDTSQTNPGAAKDAGLAAIRSVFRAEKIEPPLPTQTVYLRR